MAPQEPTTVQPTADPDTPAHDLIIALHQGRIDPAHLTADQRQQCVELLTTQGFTNDQIAVQLRAHVRTIQRDRKAIRHAQAMVPDLDMADELLGDLRRATDESVQRLRRIANDPDAPVRARLAADQSIAKLHLSLIHTARELNYFDATSHRLNRLWKQQRRDQ